MSGKSAVFTTKAPKPMPIFNQAIVANGLVFCSGQVGRDVNGKMAEGVEGRARQCIQNLGAVLEAAGSSLNDVLEVNVFLSNMDDFTKVNAVYNEYFGDVKPARTCVAVKTLPGNTDVELKCIGVVKQSPKSRL